MTIRILLSIITTLILLTGCVNSDTTETAKIQQINYTDKFVIDSLIKATPDSKDTMFLGFTAGMKLSDYKKHIQILRNEGNTITYNNSNVISTIDGAVDVGAGYTFTTNISAEKSGKTITGKGDYFLEPHFNKKGNLISLYILPIEKWDREYAFDNPNWLKNKILDNSIELSDKNLWHALIDNSIVDGQAFVRQKGSLIIYESTLTVNYIDLKSLLTELLIKETEKEIIKEKSKDIKF
jgi:hypothetical protein